MSKHRKPNVKLVRGTDSSIFDLKNRIDRGEFQEPVVDHPFDNPEGYHSQIGGDRVDLSNQSASQTIVPLYEPIPTEGAEVVYLKPQRKSNSGYIATFLTGAAAVIAFGTSPCNPDITESPVPIVQQTTTTTIPKFEDKIFTCTDDTISFKFKLPEVGTSQYVAALVANGWNNQNIRDLCSKSYDQQAGLVQTYDNIMFQSFPYDGLEPILDITKDVLTVNKEKVERLNLENLKDGRNNVVKLNETFSYPMPESLEERVQSKEERLQEASRAYMITEGSDYKPVKQILQETGVTLREIKDLVGVTRAELIRYQRNQRNEDIWRGFMESGCLKKSDYVKQVMEEYGIGKSTAYTILRNMSLEAPDAMNCY